MNKFECKWLKDKLCTHEKMHHYRGDKRCLLSMGVAKSCIFHDSVPEPLKFQIEDRYLVAKITDCENTLSDIEFSWLLELLSKIHQRRLEENRGKLQCLVIECDWPEYEPAVEMLRERVNNEQS